MPVGVWTRCLSRTSAGLIYVSISCFGEGGPFSHRAGWEQIAQVMTGIAAEGIQTTPEYKPRTLPVAANDYITGYLGAYGVLLALARRANEGGSYHVRVSLCQTAMMIYRQGKLPAYLIIYRLRQMKLPHSLNNLSATLVTYGIWLLFYSYQKRPTLDLTNAKIGFRRTCLALRSLARRLNPFYVIILVTRCERGRCLTILRSYRLYCRFNFTVFHFSKRDLIIILAVH